MHPGDPPCPGKPLISTLQLCRSQCCGAVVQGEALKYPEDYLLSPWSLCWPAASLLKGPLD